MRGYLLDTAPFLWWLVDDPRLSEAARAVIRAPEHRIYVSTASAWEIVIKAALGKLRIEADDPTRFLRDQIRQNRFRVLPVRLRHALAVWELPPLHRDPFDRMLVAQARVDGLVLVTSDPVVGQYGVAVVW